MEIEDWDDWVKWRATMTAEHQLLKDGVSNFRAFQARGTKYFDRAEGVWEADTRRRKRNLAISLVVIPCLLAALGWGIVQGGNLVIRILQIEQQWQQAHPSEFVKPQQMFNEQEQQDASKEGTKDFAY